MSKFIRIPFEEVCVGDSFTDIRNKNTYTIVEKRIDDLGKPQVRYKSGKNNVVYTDNWEYLIFGNLPVGYWKYDPLCTIIDHELIE